MRALLAAMLVLVAPAVHALEYCEELWFTRNLAFHQAGFCFGSPLGQAVFSNADCLGKDVSLSPPNRSLVARVREAEVAEGCRVDTSRTSLPIYWIEARKSFYDIPMPSLYESGCIGWRQRPQAVFIARNPASAVIGEVQPGDNVLFEFEETGPWSFVHVTRGDRTVALGWAQMDLGQVSCENYAG